MKKSNYVLFATILVLACLCLVLVACGENSSVPNNGYPYANNGSYNNSTNQSNNYGTSNNGTSNTSSEVRGITLSQTTLALDEGTSGTINASISPSTATNKTINWSSSDTSVATVQNGIVTAQNVGTCIITAQSANGITANCTVTVNRGEFVFSEYSYGYAMVAYLGNQSNVTVPSTYKGKPVLAIGSLTNESGSAGAYDGFYGNGTLVSVNLPEGLKDINRASFAGCSSLKSVVVPNSCVRIRYCAFSRCSALEEIVIPPFCTYGEWVLGMCINIKRLTLPVLDNNSVANDLPTYLFYSPSELKQGIDLTINGGTRVGNWEGIKNKLNKLKIETSVIDDRAFAGYKNVSSVVIGGSVTSIGDAAFYDCSGLTSVSIPNSVTSIRQWAFAYCSGLTSVAIPSSVTSIGGGVFAECRRLTSITIPEGVPYIGSKAFSGCSALESITIPDSVTFTEEYAFRGCSGLKSINYQGTWVQWSAIVKGKCWNDSTGNYVIHCTDGDFAK